MLQQKYPEYVELIQLTDTHIFANESEVFDGVDTMASLQQVIAHARTHNWPPDAVLLTGDLVHDPLVDTYKRLLAVIQKLQVPVHCLPGNHDHPDLMQQVLNTENVSTEKSVVFSDWLVLMLDSFLAGTHSGHLRKTELEFLRQQLEVYKGKNTLVCLHHPPMLIGSEWMDSMRLSNPEELFAITDQYTQIKGILWGHIHQEYFSLRNNVMLMGCPSTCIQFTPGATSYSKDSKPAGYRKLRLLASGEIITQVVRVGGWRF